MSPPSPTRVIRLIALVLCVTPLVAAGASPGTTRLASEDAQNVAEAASRDWTWPVPNTRRILRPFIAPANAYSAGHRGIDVAATVDADVRAAADGVVHFSGTVVDRPVLSIQHAGGLISSAEPVESALTPGTRVSQGQVVGTLSSAAVDSPWASVHCAAPCLHFGVRLRGEYVSPLNYLGGLPRSVLLPTRKIT